MESELYILNNSSQLGELGTSSLRRQDNVDSIKKEIEEWKSTSLDDHLLSWAAGVFLLLLLSGIIASRNDIHSRTLLYVGGVLLIVIVVHYILNATKIPQLHIILYLVSLLYMSYIAFVIASDEASLVEGDDIGFVV